MNEGFSSDNTIQLKDAILLALRTYCETGEEPAALEPLIQQFRRIDLSNGRLTQVFQDAQARLRNGLARHHSSSANVFVFDLRQRYSAILLTLERDPEYAQRLRIQNEERAKAEQARTHALKEHQLTDTGDAKVKARQSFAETKSQLVCHLVACWQHPFEPLPDAFFRTLLLLDKQVQKDELLHRFVLDEVDMLRSQASHRNSFPTTAEYRSDLVKRIAGSLTSSTNSHGPQIEVKTDRARGHDFNALCESIADTAGDYRAEELGEMSPEHVERWVFQFDEGDRLTILQEMDRILTKHYISKRMATALTRRILTSPRIFGSPPSDALTTSTFLSIQRKGHSQHDLLALTDEVMFTEYRHHLPQPSTPRQYIYLDDCLFSGATVFHDLKNWLHQAPSDANLRVILWAAHSNGLAYYIEDRLRKLTAVVRMSINVHIVARVFNNSVHSPDQYDCLWPQELISDAHVNSYVESLKERADSKGWPPRLFRAASGAPSHETFFSSSAARHVVEQAFLKAGAYIVSLSENPKPEMRPMGYEVLESLGFGAMFVTYRNVANNCPLALWWGDPSYSTDHPLGNWLPLFNRRANESNSIRGDVRGHHSTMISDDFHGLSADDVPF